MVTAAGCGSDENSSALPPASEDSSSVSTPEESTESTPEEKPEGTLKANFVEGEGYSFETTLNEGDLIPVGDTIDFTVKMSAFYTGYPVVYINGKAIAPDDDGTYHVEMQEDIDITVAGVQKDVSAMMGTGTFEDAFVVSRPIDLVYIAEQVNKGVYE